MRGRGKGGVGESTALDARLRGMMRWMEVRLVIESGRRGRLPRKCTQVYPSGLRGTGWDEEGDLGGCFEIAEGRFVM